MRTSADRYVGDLDFREMLAMSSLAAIAGAARKPKDPNLFILPMPHDFGRDFRALDEWCPRLGLLPVARDQHLIERHLFARLCREQRDLDRDAGLGAKLAAAGRKYCVGHRAGR